MSLLNTLTKIVLAATFVVGLSACGRNRNGNANASTPASQCTRGFDGQLRDQYGRLCSNYGMTNGSCVNTRYDATTGRYLDLTTGMPVNCTSTGYFDGINSMPYYGQYGTQMINGCQGWSQIYGAQYIPLDIGNGQLVCMNVAYLYQYNPGYNWNQYYNNYMNYGYPMYACYSYECGGGYYGGYNYNCSMNLNLGFFTGGLGGGFGTNFGMCF